ncbi:uncharacterized protein TEOVI_000420900 [Trypanosoma equiperdum]|uniref:Uncharacterized protein n=1 Tax=Trypanosoma equiperdum TaxID=5694 RepID=A0A1G4IJH6_TRYEQ|nr:hypothetical protein, conserved [Trypanosoma equiperdum]
MVEEPSGIVLYGDVVERTGIVEGGTSKNSSSGNGNIEKGRSILRPIQAVVGRAFPHIDPNRFYGNNATEMQCEGDPNDGRMPMKTTKSATFSSITTSGFTAHVQPGLSGNIEAASISADRGFGAIDCMSRQRQWDPKDFENLECGYYTVPLNTCNAAPAGTCVSHPEVPSGELYVELLLQFLRSTVRKHRECAMEALRARLLVDRPLRELFTTGTECAQLLHLIINELASAGHALPCRVAAECLVLLLFDPTMEVEEAIGEIGCPPTDLAEISTNECNDMTFAELSECMRSGEDKGNALERLGMTKAVLDSLNLIPCTLASRLLLGSGVLLLPNVAIRVASDPRFVRFVRERLRSVLLGSETVSGVVEELLVLRHVLRLQQTCATLLPALHETLMLFIRFVCSIPVEQARSPHDVVGCLAAFLVVRAAVRQGFVGLFNDTAEGLLSATVLGSGIPAEMWLLLASSSEGDGVGRVFPTMEVFAAELARAAVRTIQAHITVAETGAANGEETGHLVSLLAALSSMHYLATYFTLYAGSDDLLFLLGTEHETQSRLKEFMAANVLTSKGLQHAFLRLSSKRHTPLPLDLLNTRNVKTTVGGGEDGKICLNKIELVGACWASLTHARVRLAAAFTGLVHMTEWEVPVGYATALATSFEEKCLGLKDVMGRLLPDELCTMVEVVQLMRRGVHGTSAVGGGSTVSQQQQRDSCAQNSSSRACTQKLHIAETFLLHSIFLTKHGQDVAPGLIDAILGLQDVTIADEAAVIDPFVEPTVTLAESLRRAVAQTRWPWFLFPLYDEDLREKGVWCGWVHRTLGMHQRMKDVLQWDLILCHTLRWAISSCHSFDKWEEAEVRTDEEVKRLLHELCTGVLPRAGRLIATSASDVLKALASTIPLHEEVSMEYCLFVALAITCTACEPTAAVSIARLLSNTLLEGSTYCLTSSSDFEVTEAPIPHHSGSNSTAARSNPAVSSAHGYDNKLLNQWAASGSLLCDNTQVSATAQWDLGNFTEVLHSVEFYGPGGPAHGSNAIKKGILQNLVEGIARLYLRQRPLTAFECQALRQDLQQLQWCPPCLREELDKCNN